MASLNKIMLIGNAGKDADMRYSASGTAQSTFSLAVNNRRKGASGEWEDQTEWFNIVLYADLAERITQYITKGKPLYVEGRLQTRSWDNDTGVKQYRTEVVAQNVQLLGGRDDVTPAEQPTRRSNVPRERDIEAFAASLTPAQRQAVLDAVDDLPFE